MAGKEVIDTSQQLSAFNVELGNGSPFIFGPTSVNYPEDTFEKFFANQRHLNFVVSQPLADGSSEYSIVSVLPEVLDSNGGLKSVRITKKGQEDMSIPLAGTSHDNLLKAPDTKIKKLLKSALPDATIWIVENPKIVDEIQHLEKKHPQGGFKQLKVAIIYAKAGQNHPQEWFSNREPSAGFQRFLEVMGSKINLAGWSQYRGDMGKEGTSYFCEWNNYEVMYHISTMLNPEQHRRLIGNDVSCIIYSEGTLHPNNVDYLGTVPQIFSVVRPLDVNSPTTKYKVGFLTRVNIKMYGPQVPKDPVFDSQNLRNFLLSKLANGKIMTNSCPPLNRLFYVPRAATIEEISKKFPKETLKDKKTREALEKKALAQLRQTSFDERDLLRITVISGRNLAAKDVTGTSDPYVSVSIKDQEIKTQVQKKTLNPTWNEDLLFDMIGIEARDTDIVIKCKDWDRLGGHDPMGDIVIALSELGKYVDKDMWLPLKPCKGGGPVSGDLLLRFTYSKISEPIKQVTGIPIYSNNNSKGATLPKIEPSPEVPRRNSATPPNGGTPETQPKIKKGGSMINIFTPASSTVTGAKDSWDQLKQYVHKMPTLLKEEEEEKVEYLEFENDISGNAELEKKTKVLRAWAKTTSGQIRTSLSEKHFSFMAASTLPLAKERAVVIESVAEKVVKLLPYLPAHNPPKNLKIILESEGELPKYTKKIDNLCTKARHTLQIAEGTVDITDSSKQLIGIVQLLKEIKF